MVMRRRSFDGLRGVVDGLCRAWVCFRAFHASHAFHALRVFVGRCK